MKSMYDMIVHKFDSDVTIYPISDVHFGALESNQSEWKKFCKKIENEENSYIILNGDLINNSTRNSVANPFDEVYRPREQKRMMTEFLMPIKDRILCMTSGNHESRSIKDDDVDITYDIASKLDIEDLYRPEIAFMKISLGEKGGRAMNNYTFAVTHGAGGGGTMTGSAVNKNEKFSAIIDGLDCLVCGHTHKGFVTKPSKIIIDPNHEKVTLSSYSVVNCVSWLNYGSYAASKMLLPASTSNPQKIILHYDKNGYGKIENKNLEIIW